MITVLKSVMITSGENVPNLRRSFFGEKSWSCVDAAGSKPETGVCPGFLYDPATHETTSGQMCYQSHGQSL